MKGRPQRPENEFKAGAVRASIWSNLRKTGTGNCFNSRKLVLERIYKDSQGNFKTTNSLDINNIPKAIIVLQSITNVIQTLDDSKSKNRNHQKR